MPRLKLDPLEARRRVLERYRQKRQAIKLNGEPRNPFDHLTLHSIDWVAAVLDISDSRAQALERSAMNKLRLRFSHIIKLEQ
jgi:hypothetical protein